MWLLNLSLYVCIWPNTWLEFTSTLALVIIWNLHLLTLFLLTPKTKLVKFRIYQINLIKLDIVKFKDQRQELAYILYILSNCLMLITLLEIFSITSRRSSGFHSGFYSCTIPPSSITINEHTFLLGSMFFS